jgi:pyrroloquinoline quinone biosynthesis protein B
LISGPQARVLFLPDSDRWEEWDRDVENMIRDCDIALLDGTFLSDRELPGRDMSTIPHPTIEHSVNRFEKLPLSDRQKIHFIHLNHTNPLLSRQTNHPMRKRLDDSGMRVGEQGQVFLLGK